MIPSQYAQRDSKITAVVYVNYPLYAIHPPQLLSIIWTRIWTTFATIPAPKCLVKVVNWPSTSSTAPTRVTLALLLDYGERGLKPRSTRYPQFRAVQRVFSCQGYSVLRLDARHASRAIFRSVTNGTKVSSMANAKGKHSYDTILPSVMLCWSTFGCNDGALLAFFLPRSPNIQHSNCRGQNPVFHPLMALNCTSRSSFVWSQICYH